MDSLQLQTILRILPTALENANYEILKQIQDEVDKAKLRIFDPPYLEYFHEKFDVEKYKDSNPTFYNKFKELKLDETRRIKDLRKLEKGDDVVVVFFSLSPNEDATSNKPEYFCDSNFIIVSQQKYFCCHNGRKLIFSDRSNNRYLNNYIIDYRNLNQYIVECYRQYDVLVDGKIYIYK